MGNHAEKEQIKFRRAFFCIWCGSSCWIWSSVSNLHVENSFSIFLVQIHTYTDSQIMDKKGLRLANKPDWIIVKATISFTKD